METMRQQLSTEQDRSLPDTRPTLAVRPGQASDLRVLAILERTVELDVIPRLLLARRTEDAIEAQAVARRAPQPASHQIVARQVSELVRLLLARDEAGSSGYVAALHSGCVPVETLYLDLLAPAARQLGQMWVDDDCDFTDVTVGLVMLQTVLRELGAGPGDETACKPGARRALLVPLPGEQHTFGLSMVADFFRRAGWNAWSGTIDSEGELAAMVGAGWLDMVGFSLACDEQLEGARQVIAAVRRWSLNPAIVVMAGGPGISANPALAALIGADGTAVDGLRAVQQADALVDKVSRRQMD